MDCLDVDVSLVRRAALRCAVLCCAGCVCSLQAVGAACECRRHQGGLPPVPLARHPCRPAGPVQDFCPDKCKAAIAATGLAGDPRCRELVKSYVDGDLGGDL